jgi:hypothetical protein
LLTLFHEPETGREAIVGNASTCRPDSSSRVKKEICGAKWWDETPWGWGGRRRWSLTRCLSDDGQPTVLVLAPL